MNKSANVINWGLLWTNYSDLYEIIPLSLTSFLYFCSIERSVTSLFLDAKTNDDGGGKENGKK